VVKELAYSAGVGEASEIEGRSTDPTFVKSLSKGKTCSVSRRTSRSSRRSEAMERC